MLAEWYGWTPDQVMGMDPDFVDELFARKRAEAEHRRIEEEKAKAKR